VHRPLGRAWPSLSQYVLNVPLSCSDDFNYFSSETPSAQSFHFRGLPPPSSLPFLVPRLYISMHLTITSEGVSTLRVSRRGELKRVIRVTQKKRVVVNLVIVILKAWGPASCRRRHSHSALRTR